MEVIVRDLKREECRELRQLIQELAEYEKCPEGPTITVEELEEDGFGAKPYFHCKVAEMDGKLVGFTLFCFVYYTWVGKSIYLDDLYVKLEARGRGIGTRLMKAVMQEGVKMNCGRCTWHVLDWNLPSIEFYKRRGATNLTHEDGKLIFQMNTEAMIRFVGTV